MLGSPKLRDSKVRKPPYPPGQLPKSSIIEIGRQIAYQQAVGVKDISGRNNVTYSYGIENPMQDIAVTGEAVLEIFNERIKTAKAAYKDLTHSIFVRSSDLSSFTYFEKEANLINPQEVTWEKNKRGNLEGKKDGKHIFTWQPNGSQFTMIYDVPADALKFNLKKPGTLDFDKVIEMIGFDESWVS